MTQNDNKPTEVDDEKDDLEETVIVPSASELHAKIVELEGALTMSENKVKNGELRLKEADDKYLSLEAQLNDFIIKADPGDLSKLTDIV